MHYHTGESVKAFPGVAFAPALLTRLDTRCLSIHGRTSPVFLPGMLLTACLLAHLGKNRQDACHGLFWQEMVVVDHDSIGGAQHLRCIASIAARHVLAHFSFRGCVLAVKGDHVGMAAASAFFQ